MDKKLTPKQLLFINEYLISFNATEAATKAGYSPKTASKIGSENLTKPEIQEAIKKAQNKTISKLEITRETLLNDLERIKTNTETENPNASLKAIDLQIKMLGLNAPTEQKINIQTEQPLFGPLDNE